MQIYITPDLENKLRAESKTSGVPMSQILAKALMGYFGGLRLEEDKTVSYTPPAAPIPLQRACCKLPKPCQHWVFDGVTDTWTNTLDGEIKEL